MAFLPPTRDWAAPRMFGQLAGRRTLSPRSLGRRGFASASGGGLGRRLWLEARRGAQTPVHLRGW